MKNNYVLMIAIVAVMILGAGCSKDDDEYSNADLTVKTNISKYELTKSITTAFDNSVIGVYVDDVDGVYNPTTNSTASVTTGGASITPSPSITINEDATVYAWFPATENELTNPESTSEKAIDIVTTDDFAATDQTDYLWATPTDVSKTSINADLNFHHALSKVVFSIVKDDNFEGTTLTSISISSTENTFLTGTGTMGIDDGTISGLTAVNSLSYTNDDGITISTTENEVVALVAPTTLSGTITITLEVDGESYSSTISESEWAAATQYTYNLSLKGSAGGELTIGSATISGWEIGSEFDITFDE